MQFITYDDFLAAEQADPYYRERWPYFEQAIGILRSAGVSGKSLEIGCYKLPLTTDGDTMDVMASLPVTYRHNATVVPWPVANRQYDLLIALQVWEHLGNSQAACFREVRRVAKRAILSLPYRWDSVPADDPHYMIDDARIAEWTCGEPPAQRRLEGGRLILYWNWSN